MSICLFDWDGRGWIKWPLASPKEDNIMMWKSELFEVLGFNVCFWYLDKKYRLEREYLIHSCFPPGWAFEGIQFLTSPKFLSVSDDFRRATVSASKKFDCCLPSLSVFWPLVLFLPSLYLLGMCQIQVFIYFLFIVKYNTYTEKYIMWRNA